MRQLRLFAVSLAGTALFSCGGEDLVLPGDGEPAAVTIVQGDGASGRVGELLAEPLILKVSDRAGRPVMGAIVAIEISGASADPDTASTDAVGRASAEIRLGSQVGEAPGAVRVIAPEGPQPVTASFTVRALPASANGLAAVSGEGQTGPAGTELPDPLVVRVTDAFGNPIEGIPITWTPEGGGSVSEAATSTDEEGRTSVTRTLGAAAGTQSTLASSEGLAGSPVVFIHTVTAGNPSNVLIADGNNQIGAPRATLPNDLVVQVVDEEDNPVVDAAVTWVVTGGGGTLAPTTGRTDEGGRVATTWTLGPSAGINTAQAIASGVGQAMFTATAVAETPSGIRIVAGNGQTGQAGTRLGNELVVRVLDGDENPVPGVVVTWSVQSGGGSVAPASSTTGDDGRASTAWTLGPSAGAQRVGASAPGAGSVQFQATSTPGSPSEIRVVSGSGQTGDAGARLGSPLVVQVLDSRDNPVGGVTVIWTVEAGDGSVAPASATTGGEGRASTDWTLGPSPGTQRVQAAASGAGSVTFEATATDVDPVQTSTRITDDTPDPSEPGESVEIVFDVGSNAGTPSGTVQVTASGGPETCSAPVSTARCTLTLTVEGSRTLTATFQGSALFTASSGSASHRVAAPSPIETTTQITSDRPDPSAPGESFLVEFRVTSRDDTPTGTVQVTASGGPESCSGSLVDGDGGCTLALTVAGERTLTASYQGAGLFTPSSGTERHRVDTPGSDD